MSDGLLETHLAATVDSQVMQSEEQPTGKSRTIFSASSSPDEKELEHIAGGEDDRPKLGTDSLMSHLEPETNSMESSSGAKTRYRDILESQPFFVHGRKCFLF